jgi:hypothetical protein
MFHPHQKSRFLHPYLHDHEPARLSDANIEEKGFPIFTFRLKAQEIYCMVNDKGEVIDGDDSRIISSEFQFGLKHNSRAVHLCGFGWEMVQLNKIMEVKMLV